MINNNPQKVFDICKANGIKLRNIKGYNFKGVLTDEILCNIDKHKRLIKDIKNCKGKIFEWEDVTLREVYIQISF